MYEEIKNRIEEKIENKTKKGMDKTEATIETLREMLMGKKQ